MNDALPWTEELIELYKDKWNWGVHGLSLNKALPWTEELIEKYEDRWVWGDQLDIGTLGDFGLSKDYDFRFFLNTVLSGELRIITDSRSQSR